jgi:hypothetical protein
MSAAPADNAPSLSSGAPRVRGAIRSWRWRWGWACRRRHSPVGDGCHGPADGGSRVVLSVTEDRPRGDVGDARHRRGRAEDTRAGGCEPKCGECEHARWHDIDQCEGARCGRNASECDEGTRPPCHEEARLFTGAAARVGRLTTRATIGGPRGGRPEWTGVRRRRGGPRRRGQRPECGVVRHRC